MIDIGRLMVVYQARVLTQMIKCCHGGCLSHSDSLLMDIESSSSKRSRNPHSNSSHHSQGLSRNLIALIGEEMDYSPYRSKFQIDSIASGKSRLSRDSDLLNRLAKESSKNSHKSLSRNVSANDLNRSMGGGGGGTNGEMGSSNNSNSGASEQSSGRSGQQPQRPHGTKIEAHMMPPKIHNCVCEVAGECLSYNCNCFVSPFPCTPECCPNCLHLKMQLPHKVTNMCSCKKTRCLKLYCPCLAKGVYCGVMCRCQLCQNHERSTKAKEVQQVTRRGCACQKSHCLKKYCDCYSNGVKCTKHCGCIDCHNMMRITPQPPPAYEQRMDIEEEGEVQFDEVDFFAINKR